MPLSDSRIAGHPLQTSRLCRRQYQRQHRALSIAAAAGKGFGKVQEKDVQKVCKSFLVITPSMLVLPHDTMAKDLSTAFKFRTASAGEEGQERTEAGDRQQLANSAADQEP